MFILTEEAVLINVANITDIEIIDDCIVAHTVTKETIRVMDFDDVFSAAESLRELGESLALGGFVDFAEKVR